MPTKIKIKFATEEEKEEFIKKCSDLLFNDIQNLKRSKTDMLLTKCILESTNEELRKLTKKYDELLEATAKL